MCMYFQRGGHAKVPSGLRPALLVCLGFKSLQARGPQANVALRSFRVPRPSASSFTYRNGAPRRPESASTVGARRCSDIAGQRLLSKKFTRWARLGYSAIVRQPCSLPGAVGWMFPVGKGGARLSGRGTRTETSTPLPPAYTRRCVPMTPVTFAHTNLCAQAAPNKPAQTNCRIA